jgi:hypothetical protein
VRLFARALELRRQQALLQQAQAVALGIAEAFNPKAELLARLRRALSQPEPEPAAARPAVPPAARAWLLGLPVKGG